MFRVKLLIFTIILCGLSHTSNLQAHNLSPHQYYTGMGLGTEALKFKDGYGKNFFPPRALNLEVFFGSKHSDKFGFELGTSASPEHSRYIRLNPGDPYPGTKSAIADGEWEEWYTDFKTRSVHAGLTKYYPLHAQSNLKLFGMLGIALANIEAQAELFHALPSPSATERMQSKRSFKASRFIPLFKIGLDYAINSDYGFRFLYAWKGYSRFDHIKSTENPRSRAEVKLQNAHAFHLDLFIIL